MTAKTTISILGIRHLQCLMLFFAILIAYAMRVNMSMAIVAMTDSSQENSFDWSMQTQSVILSSFFWGYVVLQVAAGELAAKFGGKILIIICIGVNSAVSLLIPLAAYYGGWQVVCFCRVLQGLSQGFLFPSVHYQIGKWVPLEEKSRLGTFIYAGAQLGSAFQLVISGFIADYWGWPAIFYTIGALGAIWTVVYIFIGANSPRTSRMIKEAERNYIESSLGHIGKDERKLSTPWKAIFTSLPFLSLVAAQSGHHWGFWTLMTEIPSYMKKVLSVDIKSNGVVSALPYFVMFLLSFPIGYLSDYILKKNFLSISVCRKLSNSIGFFGPAIALIVLSYIPSGDLVLAVTLLTVVVGLNAGHFTGFLLVHIDMAPDFAGTLMGICNCISNVISIFAPLAAGALIRDETDPYEWRKVFYLSSAVYIVTNLLFVIFGTSERQKWNDVTETSQDKEENDTKTKF